MWIYINRDIYVYDWFLCNLHFTDSNCDLASVKKIIDTTNANHFQLFLQENIGDSDSQDRSEAADGEYEDPDMPEISDTDREESALVIAEDPPVLSPRSKGDNNSETRSLNDDDDMPDLNKLLSSELRQQVTRIIITSVHVDILKQYMHEWFWRDRPQ